MFRFIFVALLLTSFGSAQNLNIIGTGSVVGLYYPVGGAVSFISNNEVEDSLLTVQVTLGSVANLELLRAEKIQLAIAQSDVLFEAYTGTRGFEGNNLDSVRALMGLHAEPLHLVCRQDAGIKTFEDIVSKRINVGPEGSGILNTARVVLEAYGISEFELRASYEEPKETPDLLVNGEIDCFFFTVGVGGAVIQATAARVPISLIAIDGAELEPLIEAFPYYSFVTVPANTYIGVSEDVTVFGVKAFLVTTEALGEKTAYDIVKALLVSFDTLKSTYPALESVMKSETLDGLSVPLHIGALRAFKELGLYSN